MKHIFRNDYREHGNMHGHGFGRAHEGHPGRGRWPGGPRGPRGGNWGDFFGPQAGERWGGPGSHGGHGGPGGGNRMERGMLRYIILDVLRDGPKHGYEIIKQFEERTGGHYSPSPGTLYPTLQYMEDMSLVTSEQDAGRKVYHITDSGNADLSDHAHQAQAFWSRFQSPIHSGAALHEVNFLMDAVSDLARTVGAGVRTAAVAGDQDIMRKMRQALERCQNEVREILSQGASAQQAAGVASENTAPQGDGPDVFQA